MSAFSMDLLLFEYLSGFEKFLKDRHASLNFNILRLEPEIT